VKKKLHKIEKVAQRCFSDCIGGRVEAFSGGGPFRKIDDFPKPALSGQETCVKHGARMKFLY
jgi:hypothetical protein